MGTLELAVVGLTGSGIGAVLGLPLALRAPKVRQGPDVRLVGWSLLGLSMVAAIISGRVVGFLPSTPAVNYVLNLIGLASYPLTYLYLREEACRPLPASHAWWLWIPGCAYAALVGTWGVMGADTRVPFQWLLPVMLSFTALCAATVRWRDRVGPEAAVPGRWIVIFFAVLNVAQIVRMLFGRAPLVPAIVPLVMTIGFTALVGLLAWRSVRPNTMRDGATTAVRYARSTMDEDTAARLVAKINEALSKDRLFADPALTLGRLAAAVGATPHQVSEALNRHAGVSFHELLNQRRVADVKSQLLDPDSDRYTIEGIGASAGFGSRSALYTVFRRLEGVTPKEFRAGKRRF